MTILARRFWTIDLQWSTSSALTVAELQAMPDAQLMGRYQSGDTDAFRMLYARYSDRLHRFVARLAINAVEAEEIFQEVWLAVVRDRARYRPTAKFVTYLFTIAHQRSIDRWRFHRRVIEQPLPDADGDLPQLVDQPQHRPDVYAQHMDNAQALLAAIARLPLLQREAFLMQAEGDMTVEEIAAATGTQRETAKSRLRYAHQRLRAALEGRADDYR